MSMQWLSIVDFARHYNISDMTVRRRIKNGKLQAVLREGKYYIPYGEAGHQEVPEESFSAPTSPAPRAPHPESNRGASSALSSLVSGASRFDERREAKVSLSSSPEGTLGTPAEYSVLVDFCNSALVRFNQAEEQIKTSYQAKITALEERLKRLEAQLELSSSREARSKQEVEDLQLLLQLMENKA